MPAITFNLSRTSTAPGWNPALPNHDALWQDFAAGYVYRRVADPTILHDSLRSTDPATGGRSDSFDAAAGSLDIAARNFAGDVSLDWSGAAATLRLDAAWNAVRNVFVSEFTGTALTLENWVDAAVILRGRLARDVTVDGAKRAEIVTSIGDDVITVGLDSDGPSETNFLRVNAGAGADTITVGLATEDYSASFSSAAYDPRWSRTVLIGGAGDDLIAGGPSFDRIFGGTGIDTVVLDGPRAAYSVEETGTLVTVRDLRTGSARLDGTDRLKDVEFLRFSDGLLTLQGGRFGTVSPPIDLGDALTNNAPLFATSSVDFGTNPYDATDFASLSGGAQQLLTATPPQSLTDALSFDVLTRLLGASLLKTASAIIYDTPGGTTDYLAHIDGVKIGVETARAFAFPLDTPYTPQQATNLLTAELADINLNNARVSAADRWEKQILHVFSANQQTTDTLAEAFGALDPGLTSDTIVLVTRTDGSDAFLF